MNWTPARIIDNCQLPRQGSSIERVCQALHVSRATLYRRLKQEGTSFTELLSSLRKARASQLIQQGLPAFAISDELGFKDVSTYHRACKRWFGMAPSDIQHLAHQPGPGPDVLQAPAKAHKTA